MKKNHINYLPFYGRIKKIHFIGIGGIGMSGIAEILISLGLKIYGSDLKNNDITNRLAGLGAKIMIGHKTKNIYNVDVVVISSSISNNNPEIIEAKKRGITIIPRAKMLAELMRLKYGIAISGSHGKTTTTSLISAVMQYANIDPTVLIGGIVNHIGSNARLGQGNFLVAEADESDGSFLHIMPNIAVFTNLDKEHLDFYKDGINKLKTEFIYFDNRLPFYGLLVACIDCPNINEILPKIKSRITTYSIDNNADFKATNIIYTKFSTNFILKKKRKIIGNINIKLSGKHNVLNTLAAIALCYELGISFKTIYKGLIFFTGIQRRFQIIGKKNNILIVDDYAHHPTEIKAVLKAAKDTLHKKRLIILFQLHKFSRTRDLFNEFIHCFNLADKAIITDIYPAFEKPIKDISALILCERIKKQGYKNVIYGGNLGKSIIKILKISKINDVIITLGAGSISYAAKEILTKL